MSSPGLVLGGGPRSAVKGVEMKSPGTSGVDTTLMTIRRGTVGETVGPGQSVITVARRHRISRKPFVSVAPGRGRRCATSAVSAPVDPGACCGVDAT